jgi:hypothetical protein
MFTVIGERFAAPKADEYLQSFVQFGSAYPIIVNLTELPELQIGRITQTNSHYQSPIRQMVE